MTPEIEWRNLEVAGTAYQVVLRVDGYEPSVVVLQNGQRISPFGYTLPTAAAPPPGKAPIELAVEMAMADLNSGKFLPPT